MPMNDGKMMNCDAAGPKNQLSANHREESYG